MRVCTKCNGLGSIGMGWDTPTCGNCEGWGVHPDDRPTHGFGLELTPNADGTPAAHEAWQALVAMLPSEAQFKLWLQEQYR